MHSVYSKTISCHMNLFFSIINMHNYYVVFGTNHDNSDDRILGEWINQTVCDYQLGYKFTNVLIS